MAAGPFGMPIDLVAASRGGDCLRLVPDVWLILSAIFLYDLAVMTRQFDVMRASIARLWRPASASSPGGLLVRGVPRGSGRVRAPVAISAAFLVGLGFEPFQAAILCLIANAARWPGERLACRSRP